MLAVSGPAAQQKAQLISAIAALRRGPTVPLRNDVLDMVSQLEAINDGDVSGPVDGRWALIFSTQIETAQRINTQSNMLQPLIDATYGLFFKVAPALAGAQPDGSSSAASNEQIVDTAGW